MNARELQNDARHEAWLLRHQELRQEQKIEDAEEARILREQDEQESEE